MNENLVEQILINMAKLSTDELMGIWEDNDRNEYSDEAFEAIKRILNDREKSQSPQIRTKIKHLNSMEQSGSRIKCANRGYEEVSPGSDRRGELFISLKTDHSFDPGGIIRDASHKFNYSGKTISWFICDKCASKGQDSGNIILIAVLALIIIISLLLPVPFRYLSPFIFLASLFFLLKNLSSLVLWSFKDETYRSKYSRDNILQKSVDALMQRNDFIAQYGRIKIDKSGPDATLTRFQRKII